MTEKNLVIIKKEFWNFNNSCKNNRAWMVYENTRRMIKCYAFCCGGGVGGGGG